MGLVILLLSGCRDESPIVSAEALQHRQGASSRPLSARQLKLLNIWLTEHRSGWTWLLVTPPPTRVLSVTVHRQNGESWRIEFYSEQGGKGVVGFIMYWGKEPRENRQGIFAVDQVSALYEELEKAQ